METSEVADPSANIDFVFDKRLPPNDGESDAHVMPSGAFYAGSSDGTGYIQQADRTDPLTDLEIAILRTGRPASALINLVVDR